MSSRYINVPYMVMTTYNIIRWNALGGDFTPNGILVNIYMSLYGVTTVVSGWESIASGSDGRPPLGLISRNIYSLYQALSTDLPLPATDIYHSEYIYSSS